MKILQFPSWPSVSEEEVARVRDVLLSNQVNYWTGNGCQGFEREIANQFECKYAISLANGTVALDLALRALEIGEGDEVIVTPRTFMASVSSIVLSGARPLFADVDPNTQNITADSIKECLNSNTKAIILVHLAGWPCDMDSIIELAKANGLKIIEDCAQAHGATYKGRLVGSFGDIAAFSFCQDKIMTTGGEGGMVTTNDEELWSRMWSFKDHGKSYDAVFNRKHPIGFRWLHESFGSNYRMTEMQAAIGRIQLKKLPQWIEQRRKNADVLTQCFSELPVLRVTLPPVHVGHAYYKYYCFVRPERLKKGWSRDKVIHLINEEGVPCYSGSCSEVYLERAFDNTGFRPEKRLQVARELGETSLMFLVHPTLKEADMLKMCDVVKAVMKKASV